MELFITIFRWGISILCGLVGIIYCINALHQGISDIRQHLKGSWQYYNDTFGAIMEIIFGLAIFFIMGMIFICANPLIAHLCGLS